MLHVPHDSILLALIIVTILDYETAHYVISFSLLLFHLS